MSVFRIHIRPQGGLADMDVTFDHCLENRILGVGWRTASNRSTQIWDEYYEEASQQYENLNVCKYIYRRVKPLDLVWTRDSRGHYYLAKVVSGWEYWTTESSSTLNIDIGNIFRVDMHSINIDYVPGRVVASFRASRSIQEILDYRISEYSKFLWNKVSGQADYSIGGADPLDVFELFDDEETEDLLFLYLQSIGWYVVPNSRKGDSMSFEFFCVNPITGGIAVTQVKTGSAEIDLERYSDSEIDTFLFQSESQYRGEPRKNIHCVSREELLQFISSSDRWLPGRLKSKIELSRAWIK